MRPMLTSVSQGALTIDSFELLKVIGKGSFGKVNCGHSSCVHVL